MHGVPDECIGICIGAIGPCHLIAKIEIHIKLHTVCGQYVHIATNICCNSVEVTSATTLYKRVLPLLSTSMGRIRHLKTDTGIHLKLYRQTVISILYVQFSIISS